MKKLLIAGVAAVSLAVPFVGGAPVHEVYARPDCQAVDYNGDGVVDITDIVTSMSLSGGNGRARILLTNFGEAC